MPIKEPVHSGREGDSVLDGVGATVCDRQNMSSLHLGPTAAVDQAQPRHGAAVLIRLADLVPEISVPDFAIRQDLLDAPLALYQRSRKERERPRIGVRWVKPEP